MIDCCMIGTNLPHRYELIKNTVNSIEKHTDIFDKKIMSIDVFSNVAHLDTGWFTQFEEMGWNVVYKLNDPSKSMIFNQKNSVSQATSDIILYVEDDIIINKLPKLSTINKLFKEYLVDGKQTGFICFNNHVWTQFTENPKHIIDYINDLNNYLIIDDDVFLIKSDVLKDNYYLNFPVAITRKTTFLDLQDYCFKHQIGIGVEVAMTNAWFNMEKDKEYLVLISLKNEILDDIKSGKQITVIDFYNYANINFWNNDETLRHPSIANSNSTNF